MFDVDLVTYKKRNSKNMFQTWRNYFDEKQIKKFCQTWRYIKSAI